MIICYMYKMSNNQIKAHNISVSLTLIVMWFLFLVLVFWVFLLVEVHHTWFWLHPSLCCFSLSVFWCPVTFPAFPCCFSSLMTISIPPSKSSFLHDWTWTYLPPFIIDFSALFTFLTHDILHLTSYIYFVFIWLIQTQNI